MTASMTSSSGRPMPTVRAPHRHASIDDRAFKAAANSSHDGIEIEVIGARFAGHHILADGANQNINARATVEGVVLLLALPVMVLARPLPVPLAAVASNAGFQSWQSLRGDDVEAGGVGDLVFLSRCSSRSP